METAANDADATFTDGNITVIRNELIYNKKKINLANVTAVKFGWLPIRLDMYTIGGRYTVELKTSDEKMKLSFPYYFGIFKERQGDKFEMLLEAIWDMTVVRLLNTMIDDIKRGHSVSIGQCLVRPDGILYKKFLIPWEDLSYQKNYNRLTINSKSNTLSNIP